MTDLSFQIKRAFNLRLLDFEQALLRGELPLDIVVEGPPQSPPAAGERRRGSFAWGKELGPAPTTTPSARARRSPAGGGSPRRRSVSVHCCPGGALA